jgi:hypothetical protein
MDARRNAKFVGYWRNTIAGANLLTFSIITTSATHAKAKPPVISTTAPIHFTKYTKPFMQN